MWVSVLELNKPYVLSSESVILSYVGKPGRRRQHILKQVFGQYKMWNDVMFWFSQMIFYKQQEQYVLNN